MYMYIVTLTLNLSNIALNIVGILEDPRAGVQCFAWELDGRHVSLHWTPQAHHRQQV